MSLAKSHYNVHEHLRCGLGLVKDLHEWMVFGFWASFNRTFLSKFLSVASPIGLML